MAKFGQTLTRTRAKPFLKLWVVPGGQWPIKMWNGRHVQPPALFLALAIWKNWVAEQEGLWSGWRPRTKITHSNRTLEISTGEIINSIKHQCRTWKTYILSDGHWVGSYLPLPKKRLAVLFKSAGKQLSNWVYGLSHSGQSFKNEDFSESYYWLTSIDDITDYVSKYISKCAIETNFSPDVGSNLSNPHTQGKQTIDVHKLNCV